MAGVATAATGAGETEAVGPAQSSAPGLKSSGRVPIDHRGPAQRARAVPLQRERDPMTAPPLALPSTSSTSAAIQSELDAARARGALRQIVVPPCPELLARLQAVLAESQPDLQEVARLASSDVAMSATLVRVANSPAFTTGGPVHTLGQALNRLGLDITAQTMTAFAVKHAIPVNHPRLTGFWQRASRQAVTLRFLAQQLPGLSEDLAYTYGLFTHVGLPVLLQSVRGYGSTLVEAAARIDRPFVATENANHGTDHAVVGALVARAWHLSPAVMSAIRLHHDLDTLGTQRVDAEVQTLMAAGLLAESFVNRYEGVPQAAEWRSHGSHALLWLGAGDNDLAVWEEQIIPLLDEA